MLATATAIALTHDDVLVISLRTFLLPFSTTEEIALHSLVGITTKVSADAMTE